MFFNRQRRHEQNVFHAVDFNRILRRHTDRKFTVRIRHQRAGVVINRIGSRVRTGGIAAQRHRGQTRIDAVELRLNRRIRFGQNRKRNVLPCLHLRNIAFGNLHFVQHRIQIRQLDNRRRGLHRVHGLPFFHRNRHHRTVHRRGNAGIAQFRFGGIDGDFGLLDGSLQLGNVCLSRSQRILRAFQILFGRRVFLPQSRFALIFLFRTVQRNFCGNQFRLIRFQLGFFRIQRVHLSGRIDFRNQFALFNLLSELDVQLLNLPRSLRAHRHQIRRRNLARGGYRLADVAAFDRFRDVRSLRFGLEIRPYAIGCNQCDCRNRNPFHSFFHH